MSKHFTTNAAVMDDRRKRADKIRKERRQRERERQALRNLQRSFDLRGGRSVA